MVMAGASRSDVVQLRRAARPWKPRHRRDAEDEGTEPEEWQMQEILSCFRSGLNKLTPPRVPMLLSQLAQVPIYSERHLRGMVEMVLERAVTEPKFSEAYAHICRCLMGLKVPMEHEPGRTVNFRKLLLNRCQEEFERGLDVEILEKKKIELKIYACIGMDQQKRLKEELEEIQEQVQKRSVAVVKFIGELFRVEMVAESIIHECITKLLKRGTEESLGDLCVLLSVTGKDLDHETTTPCMDLYFNQMEKMVKERQTSNRVRFMLQDVVDLRQSNWIPRHSDPGPLTTDGTLQEPPLSKKKGRGRAKKGPKGSGTSVCVLDHPVQAPQEHTEHTSPNLGQMPKPGTLDLITHLLVLEEDSITGGSGVKSKESVKKGSIPGQNQFLSPSSPPPAATPAAAAGAAGVWSVSPLEDDLSCPVCCDIYTDPVVLPCSHSFCRPCLERSWREKCVRQECLICRQKTTVHNPTPNLALRNVCEAYLKERSVGTPLTESDFNTETHLVQALCPEHGEKLQFYCQDEDQLVCVECVTQEHKTHAVCSAKKAAHERKDELKCLIKSLEDDVKKNKTLIEEVMAHIKAQAAQTETQIKEEFEKLHQFLRREEEARIAALREEERDKTANLEEKMEAIERVISSLSERMKPIEKLMETDEVSFLQKFSESKERTQEAFLHPHPGFWMLLDVSKYLDKLSYRVWDRMKEMVAHSAVTVGSDTLQFHPVISAPEHLECFAAGLETSGIWNAGGVLGQARVDHNSF
ncbi:uncharacterized protein LOC143124086 isoform X3 [Alosa pseudoharengus]|uniref:uncharacterized protein LOC143124086 isoform X3 n=1 Tax=Alosa pseudoharengus TaxID=34774 RepID=UPI003F88C654